MSRVVTIPSNMSPLWQCEINGVKYAYQAGAEVEVPDEVADLIGNMNADAPKEAKKGFRLLNRIQLAEDVAMVSISEDSDGRPLKLKKALIRAFIIDSDTGILAEKVSGTANFWINDIRALAASMTSSTNAYYYMEGYFENLDGLVKSSAGTRNAANALASETALKNNLYAVTATYLGTMEIGDKEINKISFNGAMSGGSLKFKTGTIVELWGEE